MCSSPTASRIQVARKRLSWSKSSTPASSPRQRRYFRIIRRLSAQVWALRMLLAALQAPRMTMSARSLQRHRSAHEGDPKRLRHLNQMMIKMRPSSPHPRLQDDGPQPQPKPPKHLLLLGHDRGRHGKHPRLLQ